MAQKKSSDHSATPDRSKMLIKECPGCGAYHHPRKKECPKCGYTATASSAAAAPKKKKAATNGRRKTAKKRRAVRTRQTVGANGQAIEAGIDFVRQAGGLDAAKQALAKIEEIKGL